MMAGNNMKIPSDGIGYITDMEELIDRRISATLKPFIEAVFMGHEQIVQGQKKQNEFLQKSVSHDTWIKILGVAQFLTALMVVFHWLIGSR